MLRYLFALLTVLGLAVTAHAHQFSVGNLVITHPWSRPTATGMPVGVAYLSIHNEGPRDDTLMSARTPAAARVEFHRTIIEQGMARMRPADDLRIARGSTLTAGPGGLHLMLVDLKKPLIAGTTVPMVLRFKSAGFVTVMVLVELDGPSHE